MAKTDSVIFKLFRVSTIPLPAFFVGGVLLILAAAELLQRWDPDRYPDYEAIFQTLPWLSVFLLFLGVALLFFYVYLLTVPVRIWLLRYKVARQKRNKPPPEGMVLVPKGPFRFHFAGEKKTIDAFFIDQYPVTNEDYEKFLRETQYEPPAHWHNGKWPRGQERFPVTMVNQNDSERYAAWRSHKAKRKFTLPSEEQWEKAARGPFGLNYPWGNKFDQKRCNSGKGPRGHTTPVDKYYESRSPYECCDMCGNAWEWTSSWYDPEENVVVLRGGSYYFGPEFAATYLRYHDKKTDRYWDLGFRCVSPVG